MEIQGLRYDGETTWDDVFQAWLKREGTREDWQQVAREKGWQSWEEWRNTWMRNFGAQARRWLRYTILDPMQTVPNFRVGPTQSWQKNFPEGERNKHTFASVRVHDTEYKLDLYTHEDGMGGYTGDDTWIADLQSHPELRIEIEPLADKQETIKRLRKIMRDRIRRALLKGAL